MNGDLPNPANDVNAPAPAGGGKFDLSSPAVPGRETKPGYKTTEFWISVLVILCLFAGDIAELLPPDLSAKLMVLTAAIYKALRVLLKWRAGQQSLEALLATSATEGSAK